MPLDSDFDAADTESDLEDFSDDVYSGAHPALIIGDEIDDTTFLPDDEDYRGGPRSLALARHGGGVRSPIGIDEMTSDEAILGTGDALRSDKQGITG